MDKPLTVWYCDVCGEKIENVSEGYVIWRSEDGYYDFKIIHRKECDLKNHKGSTALEDFLGSDGLTRCVAFLSLGPLAWKAQHVSNCQVKDLDGFSDFLRRVQMPYYEEARRLYSRSDVLDDFSDANEIYPYLEGVMKSLIEQHEE